MNRSFPLMDPSACRNDEERKALAAVILARAIARYRQAERDREAAGIDPATAPSAEQIAPTLPAAPGRKTSRPAKRAHARSMGLVPQGKGVEL